MHSREEGWKQNHTHGPSPYIPDIISTQKGDKVNAETSASHIHFYKIINKCYFTPPSLVKRG